MMVMGDGNEYVSSARVASGWVGTAGCWKTPNGVDFCFSGRIFLQDTQAVG
jgi:hypothetical protein